MLTGDPPHTGSTVQAIVAKVLSENPTPIVRTRSMVPPNVDARRTQGARENAGGPVCFSGGVRAGACESVVCAAV